MAEEALVESLVGDSVRLVGELDRQGDAPTNALWHYHSEADEWRLLIAGPTFDRLLPQQQEQAYLKAAQAIASARLDSLTIADVKLVRTDDRVLVATRSVVKTDARAVVRAHFRNNTCNGLFVREMLILRAA